MNLKTIAALVLPVLLFVSAFSQEKKAGIISGTIKDARTKLPLNEAVVTVSSTAFQGQKFALTDSSGRYRISNLPAGFYTISFEMEGYEKFTQDSISLQQGMSLGVSFQMARERKGKEKRWSESTEKGIATKKEVE
jgi:hypothetical protein